MMMYTDIYNQVKAKHFFNNHTKVLIAVSGGVDSMNLLHFLHIYQEKFEILIGIVHVNHKQRQESEIEESYLIEWAKKHNIPIYTSSFKGKFTEAKARTFRYDFFRKIMQEEGYTALVTAHHADDQAETILMRIFRGSRLKYLSGIKEIQSFGTGELIRPFLGIQKSQFPNIFHFEDQSNFENYYFRNRIRNHYMKEIEQENPNFKTSLLSLAKETEYLIDALDDLTKEIDFQQRYQFLEQTNATQFYLLQKYINTFPDLMLTRQQFDNVLHLLTTKKEGVFPLKNGYFLKLTRDFSVIEKIGLETETKSEPVLIEYDSSKIFHSIKFSFSNDDLIPHDEIIPIYNLSPILLRKRKEGDKIHFDHFSKKLRRLFIDEKFSHEERNKAVVGEQNNEILFVLVAGKTYLRNAPKDGIMRAKLYVEKLRKR